jgi:hypothetical protein
MPTQHDEDKFNDKDAAPAVAAEASQSTISKSQYQAKFTFWIATWPTSQCLFVCSTAQRSLLLLLA